MMRPFFDNFKLCKIAPKFAIIMQTVQNINKLCKFCIKSKKKSFKMFQQLLKITQNYAGCIKPREQIAMTGCL